jgi:DNA polymerase-3 subunit epsilon
VTRQVVLDTETTGLEPELGHRIIEIGCIEVVNRRRTGRVFHRYLCPDRDIDAGALQVHGLTTEFLRGQPRFADVAGEWLEFVRDAELARLAEPPGRVADHCQVLDTLLMARRLHPGQRNGLDALCKRYSVDNSHRDLHGALLDADLLLEVYLAMTGGQGALTLDEAGSAATARTRARRAKRPRGALVVLRATPEEAQAHEQRLAALDQASGGRTLWRIAGSAP